MKILFTTDTIHRGGKERQLFLITKLLNDKGIEVRIVTRHYSNDNYLLEYGLDSNTCIVYGGKSWLEKFHSFEKSISSEKPEILISWDLQTSIFSLLLHKKHKFIFINASIQHGIRLMRLSHLLRSLVCLLSPYLIANSKAGLKANNLKPGKRNFVLYNGIENKFVNTLTKEVIENQRKIIIPEYEKRPGLIYVSVANLVPYKDYFTVLDALDDLKNTVSFYYFIIGDGPMKLKILERIKKYGLEKNVFLIGKISHVTNYLFIGDIMIHSSQGEGISNAILEAMFAGLPIIATDVGGVPETVFNDSSMLFPYKDAEKLYTCLLNAPVAFAKFDKNSKEYNDHLSNFSTETMLRCFEEILSKVVKLEQRNLFPAK